MSYVTRLILPACCGLFVFFLIYFWPAGPLWEKEMGRGCILGFSTDEKVIYYLEGFIDHGTHHQKETPITFVACDARTGRELRRTQFTIESNFAVGVVSCPDHFETILFYGSGARIQENAVTKSVVGKSGRDCACYLYDLKTGKRLGGPWDCASNQDVRLSPDGRWIYVPGGFEPNSERRVLSSSGGEVIYRSQSKTYHGTSCFTKDSRSLATLAVRQGRDHVIIVDIASGKETHAFELPDLSKEPLDRDGQPPHWRDIVEWDGRQLRLGTISMSKNNHYEQLTYRFEVGESGLIALGKEPEYRVTRMDGQSYIGFQRGDAIQYLLPGLAAWPDWLLPLSNGLTSLFAPLGLNHKRKSLPWPFTIWQRNTSAASSASKNSSA